MMQKEWQWDHEKLSWGDMKRIQAVVDSFRIPKRPLSNPLDYGLMRREVLRWANAAMTVVISSDEPWSGYLRYELNKRSPRQSGWRWHVCYSSRAWGLIEAHQPEVLLPYVEAARQCEAFILEQSPQPDPEMEAYAKSINDGDEVWPEIWPGAKRYANVPASWMTRKESV